MITVMPMAMIPMGADCFSNNSMLSISMKALFDSDMNSPATEKKINSNRMNRQIAPRLRRVVRVTFVMVCSSGYAMGDQSRPRLTAMSSQTARIMMTQVTTYWT